MAQLTIAQLKAGAKTALLSKASNQEKYRKTSGKTANTVLVESLDEFKKAQGYSKLQLSTVIGSGKSVIMKAFKGNVAQPDVFIALSTKAQENFAPNDEIVSALKDGSLVFTTWATEDGEVVTNIGLRAGVTEFVEC